MPEERSKNGSEAPPDQGRAGWGQVGRQDQLHWSDQRPSEEERSSATDADDHDSTAKLDPGPREDDGFADYLAGKDDDTPDTNWDLDDYRRTAFAGSRDGTNHPLNPPDINGQPPVTLKRD